MHFSRLLGKVNVVYKPLLLRAGWAVVTAEARLLEMEGGDRLVIVCPDFSKGKEMTCCLLANQHRGESPDK